MFLYMSVISVYAIAFWTVLDYFRSLCIRYDSSIDTWPKRVGDHQIRLVIIMTPINESSEQPVLLTPQHRKCANL